MNAAYPPQPDRPQGNSQPMSASALPLAIWGATDKGRQREGNEDALFPHSESDTFPFKPGPGHLSQKGQLLMVADGVGGAQAGREASHWAIRVAVERYYDLPGPNLGADLRTAIEAANASLYQYLQSTGAREAGCTMTAAVVHGNTLYVANIGDSRVYLIRNRQAHPLTRDHTVTQQKIDQGLLRPEQAELDPGRNVLTRSLGAGPTVQADLFPPLQLVPGDIVLLCSDGLADMVSDEEIARLANDGSPRRATERLIAEANKRGGFDNISVVVARAGGKQPAPAGGWLESIRGMSRRQRVTLMVGTALVAGALCAMVALGLWMYGRPQATPTPTTTATVTVTPGAATTVPVVVPTTVPPTNTASPGQPRATSTSAPTFTPTNTPRPPTLTPTPTETPVPPTDTPQPQQEPGPQREPGPQPEPNPTQPKPED